MNKSPDRLAIRSRGRAANPSVTADARTNLVRQIVAAESAALDARTAKLRALRLAREEADRVEALANPKPAVLRIKKRSNLTS